MTMTAVLEGITTDDLCEKCGAEFVLVADDAPDSICLNCSCGSRSALN